LNHGGGTDEKDPSAFDELPGLSAHKLHYFRAGTTYLQVTLGNIEYEHGDSGIPNIPISWLLLNHG
jgi:hypothetical protein